MKVKQVKQGMELPKRTYLDGVIFDTVCPECGNKCSEDFGEQYLSCPEVGKYESLFMYCEECDNEWEAGKIKVDLVVTIKENDE